MVERGNGEGETEGDCGMERTVGYHTPRHIYIVQGQACESSRFPHVRVAVPARCMREVRVA